MTGYLLDTHALIFWINKENISKELVLFLDEQNEMENLYISPISFWEIALLVKKGRIQLGNVTKWQSNVMTCSNIKMLDPGALEMIESVNLPDFHKDPFDRLLIAQALNSNYLLVTKDESINKYDVKTFWI